MSVVTDRVM